MDEGSSEVKESVQSTPEDGISGTTNSTAMEAPSPMVIDPSPQNQYVLLKPENLIGSQINQSTLQQASVSLPQGFKGQNITILQPHFLPKVRLSGSRPLIAVNRPGLIPVQVSQARPIIINSITQNSIQKHHILPKGSSPEKHGVPTTVTKQVYMPVSFAPGSSATSTLTVRSIAPRVAVAGNVLQGNEVEQQPRAQPVAPRAIAPQPRQLILPAQVGGAPIRLNSSSLQSLGNNVVRLQGPSGEMVQAVITQVHQVRSSNSQDAISVNIQSKANRDDEPMNGDDLSVDTKPVKKPCNCTKSQCLKLYCDCFANGEFCKNCNCMNCSNNRDHEAERSKAIKACLERNPYAFHPKIGKSRGIAERRHTKGCHCKRSGCLKNYCECYEAKIMCSTLCRCTGCKNFEESPERKTLMHLADAAEVRVLQQNAARSKLESQLEAATSKSGSSNTEKTLPFAFITSPVVNATCECLMARAEEAELNNMSEQRAERLLLDEFGRSLRQIIQTANKAKDYSV